MVTFGAPLKVTGRVVPGTVFELRADVATWTGPIRTGSAPKRLESRMRTRDPPMLVRTICRTLCRSSGGPPESGAAAHAATHDRSIAESDGVVAEVAPRSKSPSSMNLIGRVAVRLEVMSGMPPRMCDGRLKSPEAGLKPSESA
jgi:hypothetical protein